MLQQHQYQHLQHFIMSVVWKVFCVRCIHIVVVSLWFCWCPKRNTVSYSKETMPMRLYLRKMYRSKWQKEKKAARWHFKVSVCHQSRSQLWRFLFYFISFHFSFIITFAYEFIQSTSALVFIRLFVHPAFTLIQSLQFISDCVCCFGFFSDFLRNKAKNTHIQHTSFDAINRFT